MTLDHRSAFVPAADVVVGDADLVLTLDLPGFGPGDVVIELDGKELVVRGERAAPPTHEGARAVHRERRFGGFERRLALPAGVDPAGITASLEHGVLSLLVPRPVAPRPTRIPVGQSTPAG